MADTSWNVVRDATLRRHVRAIAERLGTKKFDALVRDVWAKKLGADDIPARYGQSENEKLQAWIAAKAVILYTYEKWEPDNFEQEDGKPAICRKGRRIVVLGRDGRWAPKNPSKKKGRPKAAPSSRRRKR